MSGELNFKTRMAARRFHKGRADYYAYMQALLKSSGGSIKILDLFENDIQRYEGKPRGDLCAYWYDRYSTNGGNLADAFQGTLPDDEVAIIRVSQDAGGDALLTALDDIARLSKLTDKVSSESLGTIAAGLVGLVIAILMLTAFPLFSVSALQNAYDFLPLDAWGPTGKRFYRYATVVKDFGLFALVFAGFVMFATYWSIANLTGPKREWLDDNFALYRVIRDLKGAVFLATMSTLTRKRGGVMFTLSQSLEAFGQSARSPWLRWRIGQIIDGADASGGIGVEAFNTGMISREMFFFLEDMQRAKGFAEGFEATGQYVEEGLLASIIKKMTIYRWALLLSAVGVALAMFGWQFSVIFEMRGAMTSYLATG